MREKLLKRLAVAVCLAAMALPMAAQQLTTTREVAPQAAPKKADLKPKYLVAFGRVLARTDKSGVTKFNYQGARLISEVRPNGVVGTYQYDSGKLTGIVYTDGRYITLVFNADGALSGLTTDTGAKVKFVSAKAKLSRLRSFLAIQTGIAALRNPSLSSETIGPGGGCTGTDGDTTCTVHVDGSLPEGDGGWAGYNPYGGGSEEPASPMSGEGGVTNPPNETPDQCKINVCIPASVGMSQYCKIAGSANPATYTACMDKAVEYYGNCSRSCETNDWSWLDLWNFNW